MTLMRTTASINKTGEAGTTHGQIRSTDALRRVLPTRLTRVSHVSWLDPPGDLVRPKFSNIFR